MSGGTALMLMMRRAWLRPTRLVSLRRLGLDGIELGARGGLRVGAMTTLRALEKSRSCAGLAGHHPLRTLSNVRVRNVATVGGHSLARDPHMDLPPLLSALDASVASPVRKASELPGREPLCRLPGDHAEQGEIITRLTVPPMAERRARPECTTRSADDWPALGVAVVLDGENTDIVVSAAPTGRRGSLPRKRPKADASRAICTLAAYKKQLVRVYVARAIHEARQSSH